MAGETRIPEAIDALMIHLPGWKLLVIILTDYLKE
jgi:hypothetical protein